MDASYKIKNTIDTGRRVKLLMVLIMTLAIVTGTLNMAVAQKFNMSDWRVPPPLAPSNTTKGNTTGKNTVTKPAILTFTDIPVGQLPKIPDVQVPLLAAISTTPPQADVPDQPDMQDAGTNLSQLPLPEAPDAPPLPRQTLKDMPMPTVVSLPMPDAPEMPAFPTTGATSSGQATTANTLIPVTPGVISLSPISVPTGGTLIAWPSLEIPGNIDLKLITPAGKNTGGKKTKYTNKALKRGRGRGSGKVKAHH